MDGSGEHLVYPDRRWSRNYISETSSRCGCSGNGKRGGRQPERLQQLRRLTAAIWRRGCVTATDAFPQPRCAVDSPFQTELGTARCHTNERLGLGKERGFDRRVRRIQLEKKLRQEYEWEGTRLAQCRSTKVLLRSFVYFLTECQSPKMMMQSRSVLGRGFTMNLDRTLQEIGRTMTIVSHERGHWLPGRPYDKGTALL